MIRVAVAGCGKIAQVRHLPEYADNEHVKIAAVHDRNEQRMKKVAEKYGAKAYADYQDLLADKEIDAVSICTANVAHCEMTVQALEAGKHVLCEKPMAVTLDECLKMIETAKRTGKFLMIAHNQRLAKAHVEAKKLIDSGRIGRIITFRTTFGHGGPESWTIDRNNVWFFDKKSAFFGAMADLGIHKTDLIQFLTGQKITEVTAFLGTLDKKTSSGEPIAVDDNAICIYKMSDNTVGTMTASWTYYGKEDNSTVLYGTEGIMKIYDDPEYSIIIDKKDGTRELYQVDQIQTNESQTKSGIIDLWVDCLVQNKEPEISGENVLHAMKAVFAAAESAEKGCTVTVE